MQKHLGDQIMTDKRKTYELKGGGFFASHGSGSLPLEWRNHGINISYIVYGADKMALVTARCTKVNAVSCTAEIPRLHRDPSKLTKLISYSPDIIALSAAY